MHQALNKLERNTTSAPIAEQHFIEAGYTLRLRPVNPYKDPALFFSWMDDPVLQANWGLRENSVRLDRHYQLFQETENRQSFLMEKSDQPVFQFDIFLIHYHELYLRIPTTTGDCILHYLILFREENRDALKKALVMQLDYFFGFPECRRLWLPVPEEQTELKDIFTETGFKYRASYTARQRRYALYYLKRAAYIPIDQVIP